MREVMGDVGENLDRLTAFIETQGIALEFNERIAPALGVSYGGKIVLLPGQLKAAEFSTLVHELAHELLHKADRRTLTTKVVRETEAEAIAFVVGKRRRDEALAQATGLRVLSAIVEAVPVRMMKRDLLFVVERLSAVLDERRLAIVIWQHGIGKAKDADPLSKLVTAFLRKSEEGILGRLLGEMVIIPDHAFANRGGKGTPQCSGPIQSGR